METELDLDKQVKEFDKIPPNSVPSAKLEVKKEFNLSDEREEVKKFLEAYLNINQVDVILRLISKQDKEFIKIVEEIVLNPKTTLIRKVGQIRAKAGPKLITK